MIPTIMIVANDPNIAYLLQRYAEEGGFQTVHVCSDEDVLAQARELLPNLIILGIEADSPTDDRVVRELKTGSATCNIPIVIYSYLDELESAPIASIDAYLPKTVTFNDFMATLKRVGQKQSSKLSKTPPSFRADSANGQRTINMVTTRGESRVTENVSNDKLLLQVNGLKMHFAVKRGFFASKTVGYIKAVDDVNFYIREGETLGLVGESGCGKTTTGRLVLRAYEPTAGQVWFQDRKLGRVNIPTLDKKELAQLRQNMQLIFQDPYASLNPRMTLLEIVGEPLYVNHIAHGKELKDRVAELLSVVGLRPEYMARYPHAFSGGQRQRIGVARALALHPQLVICDEPVSALDVSIQAQILNLLKDLQAKFGLTYLFISHDLSVVEHISDRVAVMYVGKLVESAATSNLYINPRHPYTEALLSAVPKPDPRLRGEPIVLTGEVADPGNPPSGCYFHPRCPYKIDRCATEEPKLREITPEHFVSCHRAEELKLVGVLGQAKSAN